MKICHGPRTYRLLWPRCTSALASSDEICGVAHSRVRKPHTSAWSGPTWIIVPVYGIPISSKYGIVSVTGLLRDPKWQSLADQRCDQRLTLLYKILNGHISIQPDCVNLVRSKRPARGQHTNPNNLNRPRALTTLEFHHLPHHTRVEFSTCCCSRGCLYYIL